MVDSDCFVSVVAPLRDDEDIVESFVEDTMAMLRTSYANHELVLVDDGSKDATVDKVRELLQKHENIRLIRLSRTFGQEIAISAGLDSVIGDFTAVLLPEMDPPELVPEMVERSRQGAGIVFGIREHRTGEPLLLKAGATFFYWFCIRVLKLNVPKNSTHFRVLSRQAVNALSRIRGRGRYLRTLSQYVGYGNQGFPYAPIQRRARKRNKGLGEAVALAVNVIVANTANPLRLVSFLGVLVASLNLVYIAYVLATFGTAGVAASGITGSLQGSIMFFFLFLILAILCEYVGRILAESSGRPLYYVLQEEKSSSIPDDESRRNVVTHPGPAGG